MGSLLDNRALMEHDDLVAEFTGGQPVRNENGCLIACNLIESRVDLRLCHGIKRRGRLVKDNEGRVLKIVWLIYFLHLYFLKTQ